MFVNTAGTVVYSATDLSAASACEWAVMRGLDARLGRITAVPSTADALLERTARLGDAHEERYLEALRSAGPVVEIDRPDDPSDLENAVQLTAAAFSAGAPVVYQAAFFDGRFLGYADFVLLTPDGRYEVYDTKLARHARITALLQLAAYSEQLQLLGIPTGDRVHLILGDGSTSTHRLSDILPVYRQRRLRLEKIIDERVADSGATEWNDPRYSACGRCAVCEQQVQLSRDLLLVNGLRGSQREALRASGITTIDALATSTGPVIGLSESALGGLRTQASLQCAGTPKSPVWRVIDPTALAALPIPDAGDIFFDFEGDPLFSSGSRWGLDYLFGLVEPDATFHAFWAHDLAGEKQSLIDFLAFIADRRLRHPSMHIYHYASYERTHLLSIAARHGVGEEAVDDLLRHGVLVDLYPIVKQAIRVGSRSYSLKKLEPLYMGDTKRQGVDTAVDSITEYERFRTLTEAGDSLGAASILRQIADYNEYDCVSTLALRDWLSELAREQNIELATARDFELPVSLADPDPVGSGLAAFLTVGNDLGSAGERTADQTAIALAAAAIDYHRREAKSFWWDHYARLSSPVEDWADTRGVFVIEHAEVIRRWGISGRARTESRVLKLRGTAAPGSSFGGSEQPYLLYDQALSPVDHGTGQTFSAKARQAPGTRAFHDRTAVELDDDGSLLVTERLRAGETPYDHLPIALTPGAPPRADSLVTSISEWGGRVLEALPAMIPDAALDILRRHPPRQTDSRPIEPRPQTVEGPSLPPVAREISEAVRALDHSYFAVQGPPGTGKTWNGARVIADLVQTLGWRVGVVAQSHATVENMLTAIVDAGRDTGGRGLDSGRVGKIPRQGEAHLRRNWTALSSSTQADFLAAPGCVIGGTSWLFSNANKIARHSLDLLVIDEAGQFSLASTIAVSAAAKRLLLLGDPQQLPQVSQGSHPEPVDVSALGWLSAGHDVLPPEFGVFLDTTHRMHPALCAPVSELSYEGKLRAFESDRHLGSVEPGLHALAVEHRSNSTSSAEEAAAVVRLVRRLLGLDWTSGGSTRPLSESDIIVVAPYNAQVQLVRTSLAAAGFGAVSVGTVDRFQGREAALSIVTLAASSAADVPRGLDFLLLANRLNVALSRAQWASFLLYSPAITETLPTSVAGLASLSAFIRLVETAIHRE